MSERENGQLRLPERAVRSRISADAWQQVKTAYASGIGLREIARNMNIPEGTVLARAKREGWTRQIEWPESCDPSIKSKNSTRLPGARLAFPMTTHTATTSWSISQYLGLIRLQFRYEALTPEGDCARCGGLYVGGGERVKFMGRRLAFNKE
jgi:hypothetical protein